MSTTGFDPLSWLFGSSTAAKPGGAFSDPLGDYDFTGKLAALGPNNPTSLSAALGGLDKSGGGLDATNGGLGWNIGTGRLAMSGLGALGNLWSSFQAQDLAKKQFGLTRDVMDTNLANQIKSYNTRLSDLARARGVTEGQSQAQVDDYVTRNQLSR